MSQLITPNKKKTTLHYCKPVTELSNDHAIPKLAEALSNQVLTQPKPTIDTIKPNLITTSNLILGNEANRPSASGTSQGISKVTNAQDNLGNAHFKPPQPKESANFDRPAKNTPPKLPVHTPSSQEPTATPSTQTTPPKDQSKKP